MNQAPAHFLHGLSALSRYFRKPLAGGASFELVEGSIVDIAKKYEQIKYPGVDGIDALVTEDDIELIFTCVEKSDELPLHPLNVMNLLYDTNRGVYIDRADCYRSIRSLELSLQAGASGLRSLTLMNLLEAAALVSSFGFSPDDKLSQALNEICGKPIPAPLQQRLYLSAVVAGEYPAAGLKLLKDYGAVEALWPEIHALVWA